MEKILDIDGKQVRFKSTAAFAKRYKAQFGRNVFSDFYRLSSVLKKDEVGNDVVDYENLDIDVFYDIAWVMAKTAEPSLPPVTEWLDTFDEFPIEETLSELVPLITQSLVSAKKK